MSEHLPSESLPEAKAGPFALVGRVTLYLAFCLFAFITTVPFVWMIFSSFKPRAEVEETHFVPHRWEPQNYAVVLKFMKQPGNAEYVNIDFARYYCNSIFVTFAVAFFQLFACAMAAYAFSRIRWRGRDELFLLYLATLMVPGVVLMIPNFQIMVTLHLIDSYTGLILPSIFTGSAFGTFLLRQFMLTVPRALDEAAAIDGASHWQIFWEVILPLSRAGLMTLGLFAILNNYQSFFWPLVMLKSDALFTLPVGLLNLDFMYEKQTELILAATVMSTLPLIVLFIFCQRAIVQGIQMGAVKG